MLEVVGETGIYGDGERAVAKLHATDALRDGWEQFMDKANDEEQEAWREEMEAKLKLQTRTTEDYRAIITDTEFKSVDQVAV